MRATKLNQYQLLAGPYRVAVWSMLTRFKTEFVRQSAERFKTCDPQIGQRVVTEGLRGLRQTQAWLFAHRSQYETWLTTTLEGLLIHETHMPPAGLLAEQRVSQIQRYLAHLISDWERLLDAPSFRTAFIAFAQAIWPYYCVTYPSWLNVESAGLNFCTWVADAELLEVVCCPALATRKHRDDSECPTLRLCPSLDPCFDTDDAEDLKHVLNIASHHQLDFEHIEDNLGHVQRLSLPGQHHRVERIIDLMSADWLKGAPSPFTDLFHFNAATYRYLVKGPKTESGSDTVGVLFLATPALECLKAMTEDGTTRGGFQQTVPSAWADAGGGLFAETMHRDFAGLRDEFNMLDQSARAAVFGDVSHNMKNLLASVAGLIRIVQDPKVDENRRRAAAQIAEYISTYAGQEFGMKSTEMSMAEVRALLQQLTDWELLTLVRLDFKRQLIARQAIDMNHKRAYMLDGETIAFDEMPIDDVIDEIREHLMTIYRRLGHEDRAAKLAKMVELRLEKDGLSLAVAIICREIVDNMRPREKSLNGTIMRIDFEPKLSKFKKSRGWRSIKIVQQLTGDARENPFEGADRAASIQRFNSRFADHASGIASMHCDLKRHDSTGQWFLEKMLSFPPKSAGDDTWHGALSR